MTLDPDSRVERVLEQYFLAIGDAEDVDTAVDVLELCAGDRSLADRVEAILQRQSDLGFLSGASPTRETFGDYELVERIGSGGSASVYHAVQRQPRRAVALKILHRSWFEEESARGRFRREIDAIAELDHPHIVPVFAVSEHDGTAYLAMKLLSGPNLADVGTVSCRRAAEIGCAIAEALEAAHRRGILHRDVKPGNIVLDGDHPYLVDFGLARRVTDPTLTREGALAGTLVYAAPERLQTSSNELTASIDVYSLGATLYEIVSGSPPFGHDDAQQLAAAILTADPRPLRLTGADRDFETIVMRAMRREVDARHTSAGELADELRRYLAHQPIRSRRPTLVGRARLLARRHPRTTSMAGLAVVLLAILSAALLFERIGRRAELRQQLAAAESRLEKGEYAGLLAELEGMAQLNPGDPSVARVLMCARAGIALHEILTALARVTAPVEQDLEQFRAWIEQGAFDATARHTAELALVLATLNRRGTTRALGLLSDCYSGPRDTRAFLAVSRALAEPAAEIPDAPAPLPTARGDVGEDEALVTTVAVVMGGGPNTQAATRGLAKIHNLRRRLAWGTLAVLGGEYARARIFLAGCPEMENVSVAEIRCRLNIENAATDQVRAVMERFGPRTPTLKVVQTEMVLVEHMRSARWGPLRRKVDTVLAEARDPLIRRAMAEWLLLGPDPDEERAIRLVESVCDDPTLSVAEKDVAVASLVVAVACRAARQHGKHGPRRQDLRSRWMRRAQGIQIPLLRALALRSVGRALHNIKDPRGDELLSATKQRYPFCRTVTAFPDWGRWFDRGPLLRHR